jgi:acetyl-CoA acetyltransferase family protein
MGERQSIVILDGARRTPRADILHNNQEPGLFSRFTATQLGGMAIKATLENTDIDRSLIGHVVMGMAQHANRDSIYGAQGMAWRGGLDDDVPALTVARICGSGAEAVAVGAEIMLAGVRHDPKRPFMVVGGGESMQYPFCLFNWRGRKVGAATHKYGPIDVKQLPPGTHLQDAVLMGLWDPGAQMAMANTAEELGRRYEITREQADEFGYRSHVNAKQARDQGWFDEEIEPIRVQLDGTQEPVEVAHDTHVMDKISMAKMARLRPAFEPNGIITAGNASAVVDGAAAMVIGKEVDADQYGLKPLARIVGYGVAACDPRIMGWGPVPSTRAALEHARLKGEQIDHVELNEAFAPQALAVIEDFEKIGIERNKVNPMGNAIALGHPLGATGAILTLTCAYALRRKKERYGLVTMCIGGGQGISLILESM